MHPRYLPSSPSPLPAPYTHTTHSPPPSPPGEPTVFASIMDLGFAVLPINLNKYLPVILVCGGGKREGGREGGRRGLVGFRFERLRAGLAAHIHLSVDLFF